MKNLAKNIFTILSCSSIFILASPHEIYLATSSDKISLERKSTEIERWRIKNIARQITVKLPNEYKTTNSRILPKNGSGILIDKKQLQTSGQSLEYLYLVVTNNHVIEDLEPEYKVETPDGRIHQAYLNPKSKVSFDNDNKNIDLALLYFSSPYLYQTAIVGKSSSLNSEDEIFVAGFACKETKDNDCDTTEFIFKSGKALVLKKSLVDGYQIGFTSETKPGTSGGVILNQKGELVAINGGGKYPLKLGFANSKNQYADIDGNLPTVEMQELMRHFAWGIPIDTYKKLSPKAALDNLSIPVNYRNIQRYSSSQTPVNNIFLKNLPYERLVIAVTMLVFGFIWYRKRSKKNEEKENNKSNLIFNIFVLYCFSNSHYKHEGQKSLNNDSQKKLMSKPKALLPAKKDTMAKRRKR